MKTCWEQTKNWYFQKASIVAENMALMIEYFKPLK